MVGQVRHRLATLGLLAIVLGAPRAHATDKAACAAAAETGQRLAKERKLIAAREQLLTCSSPECPDIISHDCTQWLGEVQRDVASIVIKALDDKDQPLTGVNVYADNVLLHATDGPVEIDPGPHDFRFERQGYDDAKVTVTIAAGKRNQDLVATLHTAHVVATEAPSGKGSGLLIGSAVFGGVGVVGLGLFAGFGVAGLSEQDAVRKTGCAPNCGPQLDGVNTKFAVADAALVGGIISLVVAGVFLIVRGTSHSSAPKQSALLVF